RRTDAVLFEIEYVAGRHRSLVGGPQRVRRSVHNALAEAGFAPRQHVAAPFALSYRGALRGATGPSLTHEQLVRVGASCGSMGGAGDSPAARLTGRGGG
ncbi:hypothetical protein CCS92_34975, partial [Methylobacterium radiotolerans]